MLTGPLQGQLEFSLYRLKLESNKARECKNDPIESEIAEVEAVEDDLKKVRLNRRFVGMVLLDPREEEAGD